MTRVDAQCTCGHAAAYHDAALTPRGECAIGGCPCKQFEEAKKEATPPEEVEGDAEDEVEGERSGA